MELIRRLLILILILEFYIQNTTAMPKRNITIGYLPAVKGEMKMRQGLIISGALSLAIDEINNDCNILPNINLVPLWYDTKGDENIIIDTMKNMIKEDVSLFVGPEGPCNKAADLAASKNIPMFNYKCSDSKQLKLPTVLTIEPSDSQGVDVVISVLKNYVKQHTFSVLFEEYWETSARDLATQAIKRNMTVNAVISIANPHKCCKMLMDCCYANHYQAILNNTKDETGVYVFFGPYESFGMFTDTMLSLGLFEENRKYKAIYIDLSDYPTVDPYRYLKNLQNFDRSPSCENNYKKSKNLLIITRSSPIDFKQFETFKKQVLEYNMKEPFYFHTPTLLNKLSMSVTVYAAYLYDSVKLYARALDKLFKEQEVLNDETVDAVIRDGTKIIKTISDFKSYKSVTGYTKYIDCDGNSRGDYVLMKINNITSTKCQLQMVPINTFDKDF